MKQTTILNVLMYLFQHHMRSEESLGDIGQELLVELEDAGFQRPSILQAIEWLSFLHQENFAQIIQPTDGTFRVFSLYEHDIIGAECINYLIELEHAGILNSLSRELVLHQLLELQNEQIDLNLVKWVTLMVLFNVPGNEGQLANMELLVLEEGLGGTH